MKSLGPFLLLVLISCSAPDNAQNTHQKDRFVSTSSSVTTIMGASSTDSSGFSKHDLSTVSLITAALANPAGDDKELLVLNSRRKLRIFYPQQKLYTKRLLVIRRWVVDGEEVGQVHYHTNFAAWLSYEPQWPRAISTTYYSPPEDQGMPR